MYWNSLSDFLAMGNHGLYVWGSFIVMALVYFQIVSQFWMTPLMTMGLNLIKAVVLSPLSALLR